MSTPTKSAQNARVAARFEPDAEAQFRESRITSLAAVNTNTFWSIAIIILGFGLWDAFVDPANWRTAFRVRLLGAAVIVATGLLQKRPGKARWMPFLAKVRLVTAVLTVAVAAAMLDRGYGFGIAGVVAMILTGPYIALDSRDLLRTNLVALAALGAVMGAMRLNPFDAIGTTVFLLLAVAVSTLLGRVLEASHRRAFALDLELRQEARTDALTGLDNRRATIERALLEQKRAERSGAPLALVMSDLDHFKTVNDRFGHDFGDGVLRTVAGVLRTALRETDALGRWGGEEFLAILPDTDPADAARIAERMRTAVAAATYTGLPEGMTISLGVSARARGNVDSGVEAWQALVKEADDRLYTAKSQGRNRVVA